MEDIRKFIKIIEGTIDQTFDNDNIDKHDKVLKRLNKDFDDVFKDRKKKKDDDKEDVKEGPAVYMQENWVRKPLNERIYKTLIKKWCK